MRETLRTWRLLRELRAGARRPPAATARLQASLLRAAVRHAYERVPLHRRRFDEAGLDPAGVRGLEDLERIPPLPAAEARSAIESGALLARGTEEVPVFLSGGSSGEPMRVPRGPAEQRLWRAVGLRILFEHGYRWRDVTALFDSHPRAPHPFQRLGLSRTVWISTELPLAEQVERLARSRAAVVDGSPTVLRNVARAIEDGGTDVARPSAVLCRGEVLDSGTSALLERVFGTAPVGIYGLTELGYVAWQCERRDGHHVNADSCLVEVVRDGRPARPGEIGEVVVTDLLGRTAPLIRYETGDLAVAGDGPCDCGRTLPLVAAVEGRACDAIALPDGRLVTTRAVLDHMAGLLPPSAYRLCQEAPARFRLHVDEPPTDRVLDHLRRLLGQVELRTVAGIPPGGAGRDKSRPVVSELTAAPLGAPV